MSDEEPGKSTDDSWDAEELKATQDSLGWAAENMPFLFREEMLDPEDPVDQAIAEGLTRRWQDLRKTTDGEQQQEAIKDLEAGR